MKILITGASSGIGASLARAFAARGDEVWLAARRLDRLEQEVAAITAAGGTAHAVRIDVQDAASLEHLIGAIDSRAGGFDIVVANAGVGGKGGTASGMSYADVKNVFEVNFIGAIATLLAAQKPMLERGRGQLVGVSNLAGEIALPVAPDYGASKAGFSYFVSAMRHDLVPRGVHVTLVHPGFVKSEMTEKNDFPMPFIIDGEKAAQIMMRGILKKKRLIRFPLAYRLMFTFAGLFPMGIIGKLAIGITKAEPEGMPKK